jgi:hypothetical protein
MTFLGRCAASHFLGERPVRLERRLARLLVALGCAASTACTLPVFGVEAIGAIAGSQHHDSTPLPAPSPDPAAARARSGVDGSKVLSALTTDESKSLCDWLSLQTGGYGAEPSGTPCVAGKRQYFARMMSLMACEGSLGELGRAVPNCSLSVKTTEDCALDGLLCRVTDGAGKITGACAAVAACAESGK